MNNDQFFLDTYAIIEIINGNSNFEKYKDCSFITSVFNLVELNYNLKKEMSKNSADEYTEDYFPYTVEITLEDIKNAMDLKTKFRKMSIPDCVGYVVAKRFGIKILTGDEDFRNLKNVEFVKK